MSTLTAKDFASDQDVKWCPGCGDYSILKQVQSILPETGLKPEEIVFVSGIGCSSRFPYYMNTYGMHSIHGRAATIATGLKMTRPELSVWIITGDGDGLSIGGNHTIHLLRRNLDVQVLLFNNEIYGLTKGQYSPTSEFGKKTKSSPYGTIDHPINPIALALGAQGTFVARTIDRDPQHLRYILREAVNHSGTSFVEIYQNCNVFNDGAFNAFSDKNQKAETTINLIKGEPLIFGTNRDKGIRLDGCRPEIVPLDGSYSPDDLWIHDPSDLNKAWMLANFFEMPGSESFFPRPFGIFYQTSRPTYEYLVNHQLNLAKSKSTDASISKLIAGNITWVVE
ncbi:2-oxoacid:ferredoxin oxidoreductase subunit beta [Schleiferia thermophila]|uniref:2-oxoglutarate ferredoxin oxidoreductase subunit beta n=1 Tax=Schleiferia thermophila TaxID=884107 RepID=A0A369A664_9FLAO|nr:2-oxoacid:ferredoxin oxidoreductase subunit beta [Schleiferia thermophila]RCX03826.1 2-oxoglutarate ferredoxin oxidoreductase subunit beta [Schleiferia thermophila]GCD80058.1 2-oxoglutarate ferredoxin oxidoreductase subunit beta [Schleiferia thermophila]